MAEVRLQNVSKIYPENVKAVDNISLTIKDREFVVLVGPSGCGKSTTLRMIAGLEEISRGTISIGDRVVNDVRAKDRDIAMVFQNYALYPHMSVYKNMAFGLMLRKFPKTVIDERVRWAANILGLNNYLERKPKALSGGQRQRVALGRAIVRQPKAFLFDEPLSNLDAKLRVETRAELKRMHKRLQTTTIYVTHDQEEAMTLGDRVVVMDGGLIQQSDSPLAIYRSPVNRFVAGFLGTPPMNFLDGRLVQDHGATYFQGSGVNIRLTDEHANRTSHKLGENVALGVRPEGLHLRPMESAGGLMQSVSVKVSVVEPLGSAMDIFTTTSTDTRLTARVPAESYSFGNEHITLYIDTQQVYLFEPGPRGENLTTTMSSNTGV